MSCHLSSILRRWSELSLPWTLPRGIHVSKSGTRQGSAPVSRALPDLSAARTVRRRRAWTRQPAAQALREASGQRRPYTRREFQARQYVTFCSTNCKSVRVRPDLRPRLRLRGLTKASQPAKLGVRAPQLAPATNLSVRSSISWLCGRTCRRQR